MDAAAERRPRIGNGWGDVKARRRVKTDAEGGGRLTSREGDERGQVEAGEGAERLRISPVRTGCLFRLRIFRR